MKKVKTQIFLIHFAGGSCYSYRPITDYLSDLEITPLELPGRGNRLRELLVKDFDEAVLDLYTQIVNKIVSENFIIYGHSMGAYLALKISHLLEINHFRPLKLFVSGNPGPGIIQKKRYLLEDEDFIKELKQLEGIPEDVYQNQELWDLYMPILRSDFEISDKHDLTHYSKISAPIFAMMGDVEEGVNRITNWQDFTHSTFQYEIFKGGHFFINEHPKEIASIIANKELKN